jgi:hypothetical protein
MRTIYTHGLEYAGLQGSGGGDGSARHPASAHPETGTDHPGSGPPGHGWRRPDTQGSRLEPDPHHRSCPARSQESQKIEALDAGADDYLTKPFSLGELLARIRVALQERHPARQPEPRHPLRSRQTDGRPGAQDGYGGGADHPSDANTIPATGDPDQKLGQSHDPPATDEGRLGTLAFRVRTTCASTSANCGTSWKPTRPNPVCC